MPEPVELLDFERLASERIPNMAWEYLRGGAGDEITLRWNRESYESIQLLPRHLVDVSQIDTSIVILGQPMPFPVLLAPVAYQRLVHPDGEIATAKGAASAGATMVLSSFSTTTLEDVSAAASGPKWYQLYVQRDREFTCRLVKRAESHGYKALVLTIDTPILGARYREARISFELPAGLTQANLQGLPSTGGHRPKGQDIFSGVLDPALVWKDVEWLRSQTRLPVLLKGVLTPDDAKRALDSGASGIIVSNHGGRNLDTVPATIEALPSVSAAVGGRFPVLLDGGVRRGTDVIKALAYGANAVLIGRPYVFALAVDGQNGVTRAIRMLVRELEMAMALTGRPSVKDIDATLVRSRK